MYRPSTIYEVHDHDPKNRYILNDMLRSKTLALWTVLCWGSVPGAAESFTIRSAATTDRIEVRYHLTGAFGGYGGYVPDPDNDGAYRIPLEQDGKPAKSLKGILYAPSCQFVILSVDLLSDPTRSATFECRQLPTTTVQGRISLPPSGDVSLDVTISYLAFWDHEFFGIKDGQVQSFSMGKAPLNADGRFQVQIPDFSKDRVTNQMQDACLLVRVERHSNGSIVEQLVPSADLQYQKIGLKILPSYNSEIAFSKMQ